MNYKQSFLSLEDSCKREKKLNCKIQKGKYCSKEKCVYNTGRWSKEEHKKFINGIFEYGNEWKKVQSFIKSRSSIQARSHAQKFFLKIKKNVLQFINKYKNNEYYNDDNKRNNYSIQYIFEVLFCQKSKIYKNNMKPKYKLSKHQLDKMIQIISKFSGCDVDEINSINNVPLKSEVDINRKSKSSLHNKIFNIKKCKRSKLILKERKIEMKEGDINLNEISNTRNDGEVYPNEENDSMCYANKNMLKINLVNVINEIVGSEKKNEGNDISMVFDNIPKYNWNKEDPFKINFDFETNIDMLTNKKDEFGLLGNDFITLYSSNYDDNNNNFEIKEFK